MNAQKRHEIFARLQAENPHPTTELNWSTPFELLAAVLLSAQATDVGVNKATARLFPVANTPQAIIELGIDGLKQHIKTIGLFNTKSDNLMKTCHLLVDQHGGQVPQTRKALEALPRGGSQDRQCDFKYGLWSAYHCGGYAHFSRIEPHRHRQGQGRHRGRTKAAAPCPQCLQARRPSLADTTWALHVHCAKTSLR